MTGGQCESGVARVRYEVCLRSPTLLHSVPVPTSVQRGHRGPRCLYGPRVVHGLCVCDSLGHLVSYSLRAGGGLGTGGWFTS